MTSATETQRRVDEHFAKVAPRWQELYAENDVFAVIHQQRRDIVLDLVDSFRLEPESQILDVGCGAGVISVELARRGYVVTALDSVPAMVELTNESAKDAGVANRVSVGLGDAHRLMFESERFQAVVAMGVTPFLHSLPDALREMRRVLMPGGLLVINADNRWRLTRVLDPMLSPMLSWFRTSVKRLLAVLRVRKAMEEPKLVHMYSNREFRRMIRRAGFEITESSVVGFGPFTFFEHKLFPERVRVRIHRVLQSWADNRLRFLKVFGAQYIVVARKTESAMAAESKS